MDNKGDIIRIMMDLYYKILCGIRNSMEKNVHHMIGKKILSGRYKAVYNMI